MILGNKLDLASKDREVNFEEVKNKYENSGIVLGGECSAKDFSDIQLLDLFKNFIIRLFNKKGYNNNNNKNQKIGISKKKNKSWC